MIKVDKEDIKELNQILALYKSKDKESKLLAQNLFKSSKVFRKNFKITKTVVAIRSGSLYIGYVFLTESFRSNNFGMQVDMIEALKTKNRYHECTIFSQVEVEFSDKEKKHMEKIVKEYKSFSQGPQEARRLFMPRMQKSSWYKKICKYLFDDRSAKFRFISRVSDIYVSGIDYQIEVTKSILKGTARFYDKMEYD